ncbi:MAG: 30S ribosomal protein S18 [bacterium]|nr:30S ribosomal protein S18 [bacterium]
MAQTITKKPCIFCTEKISYVDYKDTQFMRRFMSPHAKILSAKKTGNCGKHQRMVTKALKQGRHMALLPFTST